MDRLFTKILLSGFHHLGDGKEKLRTYKRYNKPDKKSEATAPLVWAANTRASGRQIDKSQEYDKQTDDNGDVAKNFKKATWTVEFFEKVNHVIYRILNYRHMPYNEKGHSMALISVNMDILSEYLMQEMQNKQVPL